MKKRYTVFYNQINRTNYQVLAENEQQAEVKADRLYKRDSEVPASDVQEDWLVEGDGEDK